MIYPTPSERSRPLQVTPRLALFLLLPGALAGCSTFGAHQAFTYRKTYGNSNPERVLTYSYDPNFENQNRPFFKKVYAAPPANETQQQVRNRILYELMGVIDDYYFQYTKEMRRDVSSKGLLVDTAGLATSIASTAAGANEVKTILSAISSSVQGLSKAIDSNVLLGNTVQAIRLQMDAGRASVADEIIKKMEKDTTSYPLEAGLRDIVRYYDAGTLTSGLATLTKEAGSNKETAEAAEKNTALGKVSSSAATMRLQKWVFGNRATKKAREAEIDDWLAGKGYAYGFSELLYGDKEAERQKFISEKATELGIE